MYDFLIKLASSLGIAGLSIGILFLIYRQLLNLKIFPRLTQMQGFALLLSVTVLVSVAVFLAISRGASGMLSNHLVSIPLGHYTCTVDGVTVPCEVTIGDLGVKELAFNAPHNKAGELVDSYRGAVLTSGDGYRVSLTNYFNPNPANDANVANQQSSIALHGTDEGFAGMWTFREGNSMPFEMRRKK